jgi:hypothetical protein
MKLIDVDNFKGGWFVGQFLETAYHTTLCEVAYKTHRANEQWDSHYHNQADEINYLISGEMTVNDIHLVAPVVFVILKGEISRPVFITDVTLIVVKTHSVPGDKHIVS